MLGWGKLREEFKLSGIWAYGFALVAIGAAEILRRLMEPYMGDSVPCMVFFLAIALTICRTGLGPSLVAVFLAVCLCNGFFLKPQQPYLKGLISCGMFVVVNLTFLAMAQRLRKAREQADAHARVALQHQKEFEALMETAPVGVWRAHDADCLCITGNQAVYDLLNMRHGTNVSKTAPEIIRVKTFEAYKDGKRLQECELPLQRVVKTGQPLIGEELELCLHDGTSRWIYGNAVPLKDPRGGVRGALGAFMDITERKRFEQETLRAKREWERTFDSVPDLIAILDPHHRIMRINQAMAKRLGMAQEECVGLSCFQCVHGVDHCPSICPHAQTMGDGREHQVEVHEPRAGGYYQVSTTPLTDDSGRLVGAVHVARDINERKRMEESLREINQRLNAILDHTHMLVACLDPDFNFLMVNRAYANADGCEADFFPGRNYFELYPSLENETLFRRVLETGKACYVSGKSFEYPRSPDRVASYWDWSLIPTKDAKGRVTQLVMTLSNVTKSKLDEAALRQAKAQLAQANEVLEHRVRERTIQLRRANEELQKEIAERKQIEQALRDSVTDLESFCYSVSHDLRAPLRSLNMFATILAEDGHGLTPEGKDYSARIARSAKRMDSLIQDLLAYSRVSRGELVLKKVDAAKLLREMLDTYPEFQTSGAQFVLEGKFPDVQANEAALTQCFSNLLSNAVKFMPPGRSPRVRIWAEVEEARARLWIEDNGIGIREKFLEKIFGIFERLHPEYEGTGIGLAIVRKAAERMGGRVGAVSELGIGSRFWLELKVAE